MNRKIIFTAISVVTLFMVFAFVPKTTISPAKSVISKTTDEGIIFVESDWKKALAEAKKQNKPIFLDAYTTWCGPCRMLKQHTFTDKAVTEYFNKNFINIALDMEKGDGLAVAEKYQIKAYPTLIITDADQKSVSVSEGYIGPGELMQFGKYVIDKRTNN